MIVVTGATGQLGHLVIAALGVQVRHADYNQPPMWDDALKGAYSVLLISSCKVGQRTKQHRAVIDAARRPGAKLLAYTSVWRVDCGKPGRTRL